MDPAIVAAVNAGQVLENARREATARAARPSTLQWALLALAVVVGWKLLKR